MERSTVLTRTVRIAIATTLLPVLASLVRVCTEHYLPVSDRAIIELQVRAVGTRSTPLVGAWSRFGWDHPGPVAFYLLAIPYRLFGTWPGGLEIGALAINGAAIVLALVLVSRRGDAAMWVTSSALLLMQFAFGASHLRDEWNATLPVFPFFLLLVAAWLAPESRIAMIAAPIVATFVMQTHVAYMALAWPALIVWATVGLRRRDGIIGLAIAGALWLPVLLDAVLHRGGNLRRLAAWVFAHHPAVLGLHGAAHVFGFGSAAVVVFLVARSRRSL